MRPGLIWSGGGLVLAATIKEKVEENKNTIKEKVEENKESEDSEGDSGAGPGSCLAFVNSCPLWTDK